MDQRSRSVKKIKINFRKLIIDIPVIALGGALMALAIVLFLAPAEIVPGGVTGVSLMINHLIGAPSVGALILIINVPLFLLSWRFAGVRFLAGTVYGTVVSSVLIDLLALWLPPIEAEPLLCAVFGGILLGAGLGIVFSRGATTGGSDVISRLLKLAFPNMQMGKLILLVDLAVVTASAFVFGSIANALYAVVAIYISTTVLDAVLYGPDSSRVAYIISTRTEEVVRAISEGLERGATLLHGQGAYTGDPKQVVMCALKRQQVAGFKRVVKETDPDAFIILTHASEVLGEGFRGYDRLAM